METDAADEPDATAAAAPTPETMNMWKLEVRQQLANYRRLARNLGPLPRSSSQPVSCGERLRRNDRKKGEGGWLISLFFLKITTLTQRLTVISGREWAGRDEELCRGVP
jgi:hypothetical protein